MKDIITKKRLREILEACLTDEVREEKEFEKYMINEIYEYEYEPEPEQDLQEET